MTIWTTMTSPVGSLRLESDGTHVTAIHFAPWNDIDGERDDEHPVLEEAVRQLEEYFAGERRDFDLPLAPHGSAFQERVWQQLRTIPYGQTASYGDIARSLGLEPGASRAVGLANGRNPIAIVVPCHRVIGTNGTLTGYAGGLDRKRTLLILESEALF